MTIEQIAQLPFVTLTNVENKYNHLVVSDDHYITDYVDGITPIADYIGMNDAFFPLAGDMFPEYRVITKAQHEEYERRRDEAQPEENETA